MTNQKKMKAHFTWEPLEEINSIFDRMEKGSIGGRIVMRIDGAGAKAFPVPSLRRKF